MKIKTTEICSSSNVFHHRTPVIDRLDPAVVMKDLSITNGSDLRLLLGLASKRDPSITTKVLPLDYRIPLYEYISALQAT